MKFFRDPVWQFVGVVIGLGAIVLAVVLSRTERQVSELQIEILSNSSLVNVDGDVTGDIEIVYRDQPVNTLSLILLRIENSGNVPIRDSDYSEPIVIAVSPDAEIGEFTIVETEPKGINITVEKISPYQIELSNALLNPGDQVLLKILALDNDDSLDITARIVNVSELQIVSGLVEPDTVQKIGFWDVVLFVLVVSGFLLYVALIYVWTENIDIVVRLRHKLFGLDPAFYHYEQARRWILRDTTGSLREAYLSLGKAIKRDQGYAQKAQSDPRFTKLRELGLLDEIVSHTQVAEPQDQAIDSTTSEIATNQS